MREMEKMHVNNLYHRVRTKFVQVQGLMYQIIFFTFKEFVSLNGYEMILIGEEVEF